MKLLGDPLATLHDHASPSTDAAGANDGATADSWTVEQTPNQTVPNVDLRADSCVAGTCVAVGSRNTGAGVTVGLAEIRHGGAGWRVVSTPDEPGAAYSCCTASRAARRTPASPSAWTSPPPATTCRTRCAGTASRGASRRPQHHRRARDRAGGRPPSFDQELYKRRNVVERCFNRLKQFRAVASRYDKTQTSYQASVTLAAVLIWLRL